MAIAATCVGPEPLPSMHLKSDRACANHLAPLASVIAWCTDRLKSASRCRQRRVTGQCALPCGLARRIDIKDEVTAALTVPQTANALRCPPIGETMLLEERADRF